MDDTSSESTAINSESEKTPLVLTNASTQILLTSARKTLDAPLQSVTSFPFLLVFALLHGRGRSSDEGEKVVVMKVKRVEFTVAYIAR
jgi:hypothetical protein